MKVPVERYWGLTAVDGVRVSGPAPTPVEPPVEPPAEGFTPEAGFSVSGSFAHGDTITISRAGGGLGAHPLDVNFAGGASGWIEAQPGDGATVVPDGTWVSESGVRSELDIQRGKVTSVVGGSGGVRRPITPWQFDSWQFASYWIRRTTAFHPLDVSTQRGQHKTIRFTESTSVDGGLARAYVAIWTPRPESTPGSATVVWPGYANTRPPQSQYYSSSLFPIAMEKEEWPWLRIDLEIYAVRQASAANGVRSLRLRIPGVGVQEEAMTGRYSWFDADPEVLYQNILWQDYMGNGYRQTECFRWRDDFYVSSNSRARVEIAMGDNYEAATWTEIQKPLTWQDTQVQFECNHGGFASLAGRSLFVVLNDGQSIKVGEFN